MSIPSTNKPAKTEDQPVWKRNNPLFREFIYNRDLPIYQQRQKVLYAIQNHQVTIVCGTTGCGKSTHIPLFIMDEMEETGQESNCNIIVAMPRRVAASSVAGYLRELRGYEKGSQEELKIGYQVGIQDRTMKTHDESTKILFCTTGVMVQKLCSTQPDSTRKFSHIIIDEVHERSEDVDFGLLLIKCALNGQLDPLTSKVIIMSATMDVECIQKYLVEFEPKIVEIRQERYRTDVKYLDDFDVIPNFDIKRIFRMDQPRFDHRIMRFVIKHIEDIDNADPFNREKGTVLIFVPGFEQIEEMVDALEEHHKDIGKSYIQWQLSVLHSLISFHEQQKIFEPCREYVRRIVLATNIAESSVTVPDVEIVFDFCLTKRMTADDLTDLSFLQMEWISKSNCDQRKGRTGRVMNGKVVRLVPKWFYDGLPNYPDPEMKRAPITSSLLRLKGRLENDKVGVRLTPAEVLIKAMEPQDATKVQKAALLLKERGALGLYCDGKLDKTDGDLTSLGKMCIGLPIDSKLTRLIHFGFCLGLMDDAICLAAFISVRGIFCAPFRGDNRAWIAKRVRDEGLCSDCLDSFIYFREWKLKRKREFNNQNGKKEEKQWCQKRGIDFTRLQEANTLIKDLRYRLHHNGLYANDCRYFCEPFSPTPTWELLIKVAIAGAFYPSYVFGSNSAKDVYDGQYLEEWDHMASKTLEEELAGKDPLRTVVMKLDPPEDHYRTALYQEDVKRAVCHILKMDMAVQVISRGSGFLVTFPYSAADSSQGVSMYAEMMLRFAQIAAMDCIQRPFMLKPMAANQEAQIKTSIGLAEGLQKAKAGIHTNKPWISVTPTPPPVSILPVLPKAGMTCYMRITHVINALRFFARIFNHKDSDSVRVIYSMMEDTARRSGIKPLRSNYLPMGRFFLHAPSKQDGPFSRVKLVRGAVEGSTLLNDGRVEVFDVDTGKTKLVSPSHLFEVPTSESEDGFTANKFFSSPALAIEVRLPNHVTYVGSPDMEKQAWSEDSLYQIHVAKVEAGVLVAADVKEYINNQVAAVSVIANGVFHVGEVHESIDVPGTSIVEVEINTQNLHKNEGGIELKKADSPYKITGADGWKWTYSIGANRDIEVHYDSINCIVLRHRKPDPVQCMLVCSGDVHISRRLPGTFSGASSFGTPDKTKLGTRKVIPTDTTLMPQRPGIATLIAAIFAPVTDVEYDSADPEKPIGFLCGLGASGPKEPLNAAHDFLALTDGALTSADLEKIAKLRRYFNELPSFCREIFDAAPRRKVERQ